MSHEEPTDLQILQCRVGSAELLLTLVCQHLTDSQKHEIENSLNEKIKQWKGKKILEDIFEGAKNILNNKL
ncbi:hypothetical protein ABW286_14000 [Erwinia papayae]|uniref:Uncharacterized protein n=1 Tax=Erwinia papayae TaxID=206499 RepID=A0ABV3N3E7_9GAMM